MRRHRWRGVPGRGGALKRARDLLGSGTGSLVEITHRPALKAGSPPQECLQGKFNVTFFAGMPGGFWSGSNPSRINRVRLRPASLGQSLAFLPRRADSRIGISKPVESSFNKFIGRGGASARALPIKRPAKDKFCDTVVMRSHGSKPVIDKRRLPNTTPGNDRNDIDTGICPGSIQECENLLAAKKLASGHRRSGC